MELSHQVQVLLLLYFVFHFTCILYFYMSIEHGSNAPREDIFDLDIAVSDDTDGYDREK